MPAVKTSVIRTFQPVPTRSNTIIYFRIKLNELIVTPNIPSGLKTNCLSVLNVFEVKKHNCLLKVEIQY